MKIERGYTTVQKHVVLFEWRINEISSYIEKCDDNTDQNILLMSPNFAAGKTLEKNWNLELKSYPEVAPQDQKWLAIFLMLNSEITSDVKTKYQCFILNSSGERVKIKKFSKTFMSDGGWGNRKFLDKTELLENKDELIPNDTLTVCIELSVFDNFTTTSNSLPAINKNKFRMADDFRKLFENKIGTDVTLVVEDKVFSAHKSVLMARSPVFGTMFSLEMKENKEDKVIITGIDPEVFKYLLEFIYTDDVSNFDAIAEDLLEVANKYMVDSLKARCAECLSQSLTDSNAIKLLMLAERYNIEEMLELVSDFILTNAKRIAQTPDYSTIKSNPSLGLVLFNKLANIKSNS